MTVSKSLQAFSDRLGYQFKTGELLERALTHPSFSTPNRRSNQRLEFLGDRVLGLVMAEALFSADTNAAEGILAPRYNALVRKETCAEIAREIDLGEVLRLGRSELKTGGRRKNALLGDAMEAVLAAVYLDGGFEAAREVVLRLWGDRVSRVEQDARDPKTTLQEYVQARGENPPKYVETSRSGPDHSPVFTIEVQLASGEVFAASAGSKRAAEMAAATGMLERLQS